MYPFLHCVISYLIVCDLIVQFVFASLALLPKAHPVKKKILLRANMFLSSLSSDLDIYSHFFKEDTKMSVAVNIKKNKKRPARTQLVVMEGKKIAQDRK